MTDPIDRMLDDAADALRAETAGPSSRAGETRARVLAAHRARRARASEASTWVALAAGVILVLGGSTAWAYWTGRLERWLEPAEGAAPEVPAAAPEGDGRPHLGAARRPDPVVAPPGPAAVEASVPNAPGETGALARDDEPAGAVTERATTTAAGAEPVEGPAADTAGGGAATTAGVDAVAGGAARVAGGAATTAGADSVEDDAVDPEERRLYRAAHALHFDARDAMAAIAAWDRYLRAYPRGRFALEARYNRALCLVRAGREDEARAALEPFARGTHGGYRRAEAAALLEALESE